MESDKDLFTRAAVGNKRENEQMGREETRLTKKNAFTQSKV